MVQAATVTIRILEVFRSGELVAMAGGDSASSYVGGLEFVVMFLVGEKLDK